ncbi:MAG: sigma-70 family RNA polymerase sigma factor [Bacteroidota bacterium]
MRLIFGRKTRTYSDEEIVQGFRSADQWVLLFVYDQLFQTTDKYIQNNGGSDDDARDVFQDAMKVVFERVLDTKFCLTSSFSTFLFSICRHLWLRELKNRKTLKGQFLEIDVDVPDEENDTLQLEVLRLRQNALYRRHFDEMDEGCKELLLLFLNKKSFKEIAEILGFSDEMQAIHRKSKCKDNLTRRIQNDSEYRDLI